MTARAELFPNRILVAGLLTVALLIGVLAGYQPPLALALTLGLVFVTVTLSNLTAGSASSPSCRSSTRCSRAGGRCRRPSCSG